MFRAGSIPGLRIWGGGGWEGWCGVLPPDIPLVVPASALSRMVRAGQGWGLMTCGTGGGGGCCRVLPRALSGSTRPPRFWLQHGLFSLASSGAHMVCACCVNHVPDCGHLCDLRLGRWERGGLK